MRQSVRASGRRSRCRRYRYKIRRRSLSREGRINAISANSLLFILFMIGVCVGLTQLLILAVVSLASPDGESEHFQEVAEKRMVREEVFDVMRKTRTTPEKARELLLQQAYVQRIARIIRTASLEAGVLHGLFHASHLPAPLSNFSSFKLGPSLLIDNPFNSFFSGAELPFPRNDNHGDDVHNSSRAEFSSPDHDKHGDDVHNSSRAEFSSPEHDKHGDDVHNSSRVELPSPDSDKHDHGTGEGENDDVNKGTKDVATPARNKYVSCPEIPPGLLGDVTEDIERYKNKTDFTLSQVTAMHTEMKLGGGEWSPPDCIARHRLAVIIPYRSRLSHLTILLAHLIPILQRQQLHFRIFVVEQEGRDLFNKGRIMNTAFQVAFKLFAFHCVVFHDVDLVPESDRNMYSCPPFPRHMSVLVDSLGYKLSYWYLVGGVLNFPLGHFQQVNGYSNMYWGWGAEDDDVATRIIHCKLMIHRPPLSVSRYRMIPHKSRPLAPKNTVYMLNKLTRYRYRFDGLNDANFPVKFVQPGPLFTHIMVDVGPAPIRRLKKRRE